MSEDIKVEVKPLTDEQRAKIVKPRPSGKKEKIIVALDMTGADVIDLQEQGKDLFFSEDPDEFVDLIRVYPEAFGELNKIHRDRFSVSYALYKVALRQQENPGSGITVTSNSGSATQRMNVGHQNPKMHYCWKRPDQLQQAQYAGLKVSTDPDLVTFCSVPGSSHQISANGKTELVLHEKPKAVHEAEQSALADKAMRKAHAVTEQAAEAVKRAGAAPSGHHPFTRPNISTKREEVS